MLVTHRADEKPHDGLLVMGARVAQILSVPSRWLDILEALARFFTAPWPSSARGGLFFI
jgi:hypothetical protein